MKIREIMTRNVLTVERDQSLKSAAEIMSDRGVNGLVVTEKGRVAGVITKADIFKAILPRYPDIIEDERHRTDLEYVSRRAHKLYDMQVGEIMGTPPVTVSSDMPVVRAGSLMILRRIKQVPVVDGDTLAGIVTLTDIINHLLEKMQ